MKGYTELESLPCRAAGSGDLPIMSRTSSPVVLFGVLLSGILVGIAVERGERFVAAQATGVPRAASAPAQAPPAAALPEHRPVGEPAIYDELARQYEQFRTIDRTFERVAQAVSPAVVHIVARKAARARSEDQGLSGYEETGSGVIVRPEHGRGVYVLTNNHVVEGARTADVNIVLHDGRVLHPSQYWTDTKADIAVLRLARDDLPTARLGNSDDARVGHWVLALGSPFGLTHSVSQGIISARGRHEEELREDGVENQDFLQTDAAINPGNSGGPLVNMRGEVIGINTAIASNGGGNEGVGFSIPINLAKWIMDQLVASGKVSRGAMGVELHVDLKSDKAQALGLDRPRGAWVLTVIQPSPAAEAGIHDGDVILKFNGIDVTDLNHLKNLVSMAPIGNSADVLIWRDKRELKARVRIADQESMAPAPTTAPERLSSSGLLRRSPRPPAPPGPEATAAANKALGVELLTLDPASARRLGFSETLRGVAVVRIDTSSPLSSYCKPRDVIQTIDGQAVWTAEDAVRALARFGTQKRLELGLQRPTNGAIEWRTIRIPR
jgi:serine protease Do